MPNKGETDILPEKEAIRQEAYTPVLYTVGTLSFTLSIQMAYLNSK